jgi:hypothetical protein
MDSSVKPDLRHEMSVLHEGDLNYLLGGRLSPGSGNQFANQMDNRNDHREQEFAFAVDGKATFAKSISVTRVMWEKAIEQSHGERPMLALRFYDNERLKIGLDLAVVSLHDLAELIERANLHG